MNAPARADARKPLDREEAKRAIEFLESLVNDRSLLRELDDETRRSLLMAAGRVAKPVQEEVRQLTKALRRDRKRARVEHDRRVREDTEIRHARLAPVFSAPKQNLLPSEARTATPRTLERPRHCYVCKADYRTLHSFYDAMCESCGDYNYGKRFQTADLRGQVALITGARLKIGQQAALMLLRAGARVIVTTRFPHDAATRYAKEPDFADWSHRLQIHGLDLRHTPSVELFARWLSHSLDRLDMIINNAAQTVRRPPGFYSHLLDLESKSVSALDPAAQKLLVSREECLSVFHASATAALGVSGVTGASATTQTKTPDVTGLANWHAGQSGVAMGIARSAQLSQVRYSYDDAAYGMETFPEGKLDADLQQVDLRTMNSWRLTLDEVPTPELLEVQLVNSIAPYILNGRLRDLMRKSPPGPKHIINVSAMEGSFSRGTKTDKHPHTNMAKAALNMMTLTSAQDYAKDGIYMNAVDTGWVTDEDPAQHATRKKEDLGFQPPLDIVDGAARVIDPIFSVANGEEPVVGKFLKDFKVTSW